MEISYKKAPKSALRITPLTGDRTRVLEQADGATLLKLSIGNSEALSRRKLHTLLRKIVRVARGEKYEEITLSIKDFSFSKVPLSSYERGRMVAEDFVMANYEFTKYKSAKHDKEIKTIFIEDTDSDTQKGIADGLCIAHEINVGRDLANTPGGDMTPAILALAAKQQFKGTSVRLKVLNLSDIKKLKMGLVLGVAKGSAEEPKFIIAEYWGAGKPRRPDASVGGRGPDSKTSGKDPIILIGKGITFDTGGINLKPTDALMGMNQDMTGGATVLAAVAIAAKLKLKKNVIALVPAVENAVSGSAYRPGDVLTSMSGKTVEVLNTDAEGRLVLADAFTYAERYNPRLVIDVATLTGAALVAVGKRASVIMTRDQKLEDLLRELGEESGDYVWPLPLWEEYEVDLKSNIADIANVAGGASPKAGAGAIQGGMFLLPFASKFPLWAHIDIAPRMESIAEDNLAKGATGAPVRLLVRLIENF